MGSLGASHRWPNQQADREEARFAGNHRQDSRKEHVQETFCYEPGGCRSNRLEEWLGRRFIAVLSSIIISGPYVAKTFASQRAKIESIVPRSSRPCEVLAPQVVFRIALSKSRSSKAKLATWASSPTVTPLEWYHSPAGWAMRGAPVRLNVLATRDEVVTGRLWQSQFDQLQFWMRRRQADRRKFDVRSEPPTDWPTPRGSQSSPVVSSKIGS